MEIITHNNKIPIMPNGKALKVEEISIDTVVTQGSNNLITSGAVYEALSSFHDGTTYTPSVSSAGVISWTNDGGKPNPAPIDIVQAVIDAIGTPVIGTVNSDNSISLSSSGLIEEGTYSVKYVDEDGTEHDIGALSFGNVREWTDWSFYMTNNTVGGGGYRFPNTIPSNQYPNKACTAAAGESILINIGDISKFEKVDILELDNVTLTSSSIESSLVLKKTTVDSSGFIDGKYTYIATDNSCEAIGFRFKAISEDDGQSLADSITFSG